MLDPGRGWSRFYGGLWLARRTGAFNLEVLERLRRAREFLETNHAEDVDLDALAHEACFSKFHFLRLFRQAYGETPGRYLASVRLDRARALLETTDRSVTEICLDVGYESLGSFSSAFLRHVGAPPQRYRRRFVQAGELVLSGHVRGQVRGLQVPGCFVTMYGAA